MLRCRKCPYYDYGLGGQYCEKVGGKTLLYGYCEDAYIQPIILENHSKQKRRNKRERDQKHKKHFENLWNAKRHKWFPPVMYVDYIWVKHELQDRKIPYYKRLTPNHGGRNQRYHKKQANKHVRHYNDVISNGGSYKKVYDYRYMITDG